MKRAPLYRILTLLVVLLCCALAKWEGWFNHVDHVLAEHRMAAKVMPASGKIVLLQIDNKSLTSIGVWPWKRSIYAQIIKKAFSAGAQELAFDIDFSSSSTSTEDGALAAALEGAEGPVTLAVFQQFATSNMEKGELRFNRPIETLANRSWLATVNVIADPDGYVRSFPLAQTIDGELLPSLTSTLSGYRKILEEKQIINFNIDPDTIPTYSVIDLLEGTLPERALENRKILVGAGAAELRDTLAVPVFGVLNGPQLQIIAAENLLQGTNVHQVPDRWSYGLMLLLLLPMGFILLFKKFNSYGRLAGLFALSAGVEYIGYTLYADQHLLLDTAAVQATILLTGVALTLTEVGFKSVLLNLSHKHGQSISDLLDTVVTDSLTGIVIVDSAGRILGVSQQAQQTFAHLGYDAHKGALMAQSMPWEFGSKIKECLDKIHWHHNGKNTHLLEIERKSGTRVYEYSITPSLIAPDGDAQQEENKVATLLFHDITDVYMEQKRLAYIADHDPLTDLFNTQGFCNQIEKSRSSGSALEHTIVLACQTQRLERVNQLLGPDYADSLMRQIGEALDALQQFDCVGCHTNRKTFLLAKRNAGQSDLPNLFEIVQACLNTPFDVRGHSIMVGSQIGAAQFDGTTMSSASELTDAAIIALDHAQEKGEDRAIYSPRLAAEVHRKRFLENEILGAFEREEFELYYQPQVDLTNGEPVGCEALVRWNHKELGLVSPNHFIPILEETGKIVDLGHWLLMTACSQAMSWPKPMPVAVNISAVQFQRSNILEEIEEALALSGLPEDRLHIEITESLFIADPDAVIEQLTAIRNRGIKIALDDFGTGYSSLSYIHRFPLDKIKIDRDFVKDLPYSADSMAVINAVTALAHGFDMTIIAEGMETQQQAEVLRIAGCHQGQGYLFGKPMTNDDFSSYLSSRKWTKEDEAMSHIC